MDGMQDNLIILLFSMKDANWTPMCGNIMFNCNKNTNCSCYSDYLLWTKDYPKLSFEEWKTLVIIEYKDKKGLMGY